MGFCQAHVQEPIDLMANQGLKVHSSLLRVSPFLLLIDNSHSHCATMEVNGSSESGSKRLKLPEKEDRISALPDPLIHHILSFLPSTKDSIRTSILSKRWKNQWAHVPVLIFKSSSCKCDADFASFIDSTLLQYECSKMKKFHIAYDFEEDKNFNLKLHFATRKDVEVLCLVYSGDNDSYSLPNFIFDNASLVELQIYHCDFGHSCRINWPSLKALKMYNCSLGDRLSIDNVVSGCPSLDSLEVENFNFGRVIIIASKSLKVLILNDIEVEDYIEISCPNLEELSVDSVDMEDKTIVNIFLVSPLLHSLKLDWYDSPQLVIVSKSLKNLVLHGISKDTAIEISCPNLEKLILKYFNIEKCKLMNLPSSCCATLDFMTPSKEGCPKILASKTHEELQAVKEVIIGNWFVKILSAIEMKQTSYPLLNIKCLTLKHPDFEHIVGIVNALRCSPAHERLVIKYSAYQHEETADLDLKCFEENVTGSTCLVSHLKTVKIIGLSKTDGKRKLVLHFLGFLLKTAKALQKMVVILAKDGGGTDFLVEVSRKLLSFPRVSQHAIVELL